jgi:hypothetical protein
MNNGCILLLLDYGNVGPTIWQNFGKYLPDGTE